MLEISIYSIISSLIFVSIAIFFFLLLQILIVKRKIPVKIINLMIFLVIFRLLLPFEILEKTQLIQISKILPSIIRFFKIKIINLNYSPYNIDISLNIITLVIIFTSTVSLFKLLKILKSYYDLHTRMNQLMPSEDERIVSILKKLQKNHPHQIKIIKNNLINQTCEFGFFKQTICLPNIEYTNDELYFILSHELYHFHNKSNWYKLLINILSAIYWWNPLFILLHKSVGTMLELQCDEQVTSNSDHITKSKYLTCLLKESTRNHKKAPSCVISFSSHDERLLHKRFEYITSKFVPSKIRNYLCVLTLLSFFFLSYFIMVLPYCDVPESELQLPYFTVETSYIVTELGGYVIYNNDKPYIFLEVLDESFSHLPIKSSY